MSDAGVFVVSLCVCVCVCYFHVFCGSCLGWCSRVIIYIQYNGWAGVNLSVIVGIAAATQRFDVEPQTVGVSDEQRAACEIKTCLSSCHRFLGSPPSPPRSTLIKISVRKRFSWWYNKSRYFPLGLLPSCVVYQGPAAALLWLEGTWRLVYSEQQAEAACKNWKRFKGFDDKQDANSHFWHRVRSQM